MLMEQKQIMEIIIMVSKIIREFLYITVPIIAVLLAYYFGRREYKKQKTHELIIRRYLEQGIDLLIVNVDDGLSSFKRNFEYSLISLRHFRESKKLNMDLPEDIDKKDFVQYKPESFSQIPFFKIYYLLGDNITFLAVQDLFSFLSFSYDFLQNELLDNIRKFDKVETEFDVDWLEFYTETLTKIKQLEKESRKYYSILTVLQDVATILESEIYSWKQLEDLKHDSRIVDSVKILKEQFKGLKEPEQV